MRMLIDLGAIFQPERKYGYTVLHLADLGGNEVVVQLLIDAGADTWAKDKMRYRCCTVRQWGRK